MGRVVKNANVGGQPYVVTAPVRPAPGQSNGVSAHGVLPEERPAPTRSPAAAPVPQVPQIDWDALRVEASALVESASEQAQVLVTDAGAHAKVLVQEAVAQSSAVTQAAHNDGFEAGREAGRAAADQDMNEMLVTMRGLIDMARVERHKIVEAAEPEIVKLAMGIAERILHKQISVDRDVVVEMAKSAIGRLLEREVVTVRVNPADLERMKEHRDDMLAVGDVKHMRIIEDQRVDRGGVIVETESGAVDAKIATQVEEARRVLHIDDEIVVAPGENGALRSLESAAAT
jgi:flagellar biosynthesis/type III secretory pathway protein FliH